MWITNVLRRLFALGNAPEIRSRAVESAGTLHHHTLEIERLTRTSQAFEAALAAIRLDLSDRLQKEVSVNLRLDEMRLAIADGIERSDRAERRIKAAVARARKELAGHDLKDPGLEAEAAELQSANGKGSSANELPAMRKDMEQGFLDFAPSSVPGVTAEQMNRIRRV